MKQKDVALIIIVVFFAGVASFFLSGFIFKTKNLSEKVETVEPISADFTQPDKKYFNSNAINPTQLIQIGKNSNNQPFNE